VCTYSSHPRRPGFHSGPGIVCPNKRFYVVLRTREQILDQMSNISPPSSFVSLKYEVAPVHVMKAYARCTGIAILILNLCNGWRWVVVRSRLLYPQQITPIPIEYKARWAQSQLKSLVPAGNRTPDRPARNLVTIPTTSSQPSFWHSWQFILRTRQTIRHCVTCEVYEIPLSTAGIMVTGRTSFVYAPV